MIRIVSRVATSGHARLDSQRVTRTRMVVVRVWAARQLRTTPGRPVRVPSCERLTSQTDRLINQVVASAM
jgi:hypothetical protein